MLASLVPSRRHPPYPCRAPFLLPTPQVSQAPNPTAHFALQDEQLRGAARVFIVELVVMLVGLGDCGRQASNKGNELAAAIAKRGFEIGPHRGQESGQQPAAPVKAQTPVTSEFLQTEGCYFPEGPQTRM